MSCYFPVAWHGKQWGKEYGKAALPQRPAPTTAFIFLFFSEGRALKINGPYSGGKKEILDSDHLPDGDRQRETLMGPS